MTAQAAEPTEVGKGEGRLDIIAWPGYIERGQTDKQYDWVSQFEKETGCEVNVKTAATSDEMVSLMAKGGYDLVTASGDASLRLIMGKRVQPINTALSRTGKPSIRALRKANGLTSAVKCTARPISGGQTC
jgi:putative spermidine/putrescine transport system substrate-binding protein